MPFLNEQVRQLHGNHDAVCDQRGAEAGAEPEKQQQPALIAPERLHGRVVDDRTGRPNADLKSKPTHPRPRLCGSDMIRPSRTSPGKPIATTSYFQSAASCLDAGDHLLGRQSPTRTGTSAASSVPPRGSSRSFRRCLQPAPACTSSPAEMALSRPRQDAPTPLAGARARLRRCGARRSSRRSPPSTSATTSRTRRRPRPAAGPRGPARSRRPRQTAPAPPHCPRRRPAGGP